MNGIAPSGQPIISDRTLESTVRLYDGEPYVIGGLKRRNETAETAKAPFLGDLPLLGYLFGGETDIKRWNDVVITVTPHFYLAGQADIQLPQSVESLKNIAEGDGVMSAPPKTTLGFDQWLLDANKG